MRAPLPQVDGGQINDAILASRIGREARIVLEIGCNDGSHTTALLATFPKAIVYCFEPDPRALAKFKARGAHPRVRLFEMAIGAHDGPATFHVSSGLPQNFSERDKARYPQGWDQSGSLRAPKTHTAVWPWCKFESTITVEVRRLDSWAHQLGITGVDFIWADMQGAEGDLIAGGGETLEATRYLYTEYSNQEWYEGQPTLEGLLDRLPNFRTDILYSMDVLLRNMALT